MKSYAKTSDFLPLKEAVDQLVRWGFTEKDACIELYAALRDGKLRTREWVRERGLDRLVLSPFYEARDHGIMGFNWSTVVFEEIDWNQSSVPELWKESLDGFPMGRLVRPGVDMLEISRIDFTRLWDPSQEPSESATNQMPDRTKAINVRRGRKKGEGSYNDSALLNEMRELVKDGNAKSGFEAAGLVADRAAGNATFASKQKRLHRKYQKKIRDLKSF